MKRILVISYFFAPQNQMGAVRPTKLAKYLQRMGHEVTVICGGGVNGRNDPTLARDLQELKDVHTLREWNPLRKWNLRKAAKAAKTPPAPAAASMEERREPTGLKRRLRRILDAVYVWLNWFGERCFKRLGMRELRKLKGSYDVVFSSYAPVSVHELAYAAKKKGIARKWIADFRDELGLPFAYQKGREQRTLQMIRENADTICAVSRGILEMMRLDDCGRVLFNGFDREELPEGKPEGRDGRLTLAYCGQFNMGRKGIGDRDLTPAFRALEQLVREGALRKEQIRLVYAGSESERMRRYAAACGLEGCVEDHGMVSRQESIRLQKEADILLLASWNLSTQRGILTGKMFEYMMMDKPILCCMNGDLPNSPVKQVLTETGVGFCWEETNAARDAKDMLACLRALVQRWKAGQPLLARTAVEKYAYPQLAKVLEGWMNE